jgi:cysteine-rich repeat protein
MRAKTLGLIDRRFLFALTASCLWTACGDDETSTGTGGSGASGPTTTTDSSSSASSVSSSTSSAGGGGEAPATCTDGQQNADETDIDCGGGECPPCGEGLDCETPDDCQSGVCAGNICAAPACGDGVVNHPNEVCDDGNLDDTDACITGCVAATCGDGLIQAGVEGCDDGNMSDMDACLTTCVSATCGDGFVDAGVEECDDANADSTDGCLDTCIAAFCGDGFLQNGVEECDDANADNTDACLDTCAAASCGDGYMYAGFEECDDGVANSDTTPNACRTTCVAATCGDTVIDSGEACDDGNVINDFTCAANCATPCGPLVGDCNMDISTYCAPDGSGILTEACDPLQGKACDAGTGLCIGSCVDRLLAGDAVGCDFNASDMKQINTTPSRLILTNGGSATATVTITQGASTVATVDVPGGSTVEQTLAMISTLRTGETVLATDASYRVRSTQPITAVMHNAPSASTGDTSLLIPAGGWGNDHFVASYVPLSGYPAVYTVTARVDNTQVTLTPSALAPAVVSGAGVDASGSGTVTLNADDVLQVVASGNGDLSGTRVTSTQPVHISGGVTCAQVPNGTFYCDHLEDSIPAVSKLGTQYVVAPAPANGGGDRPSVVRIIATEPNTTISYEPASGGPPASIALAGGFLDVGPTAAAYQITASAKVLVAQYYPGENYAGAGQGTGDPSMKVLTPVGRYRNAYTFGTSSGYTNFLSIVLPSGSTVLLDGAAVNGATAVGASGFDRVNVSLASGTHNVSCAGTCAVDILGLGPFESYWHPVGAGFNDL